MFGTGQLMEGSLRKIMVSAALAMVLAACHNTASTDTAASGNDAASAAASADGAPSYQIDKVSLPGEGRGDYLTVDNDARRLYVTHSARVQILDIDTLKPVGEVTGLKASHGVALAHGHGFVTDGDSNAVVMFDPATGKTQKVIPAGQKPDSILHDPASDMILAFDGDSSEVTVIDPVKAAAVKTIKLPDGPEYSQADGQGMVWVNMEEGNAIAAIDTKAMKLDHVIKLDGCDGPAPLAFDARNRRLFSGCGNKVMTVTDADSGKVIATVPIGGDPDGIAFDPDKARIFVANRDKTWTVIDQKGKDSYAVNQTLPIDEYAKTVALDPKTHRLFSSTADLVWPKPTPGKKLLPNAAPNSFRLLVISEK
jgi:DNA-binding beta-propeller fold protein YncE